MKKTYQVPALEAFGAVAALTATSGTQPRPDISENNQVPTALGSFDTCDNNPRNNPPGSNCQGN